MRKLVIFVFILASVLFAASPSYLLGLRNSKYAMVGVGFNNYGIAIENSLFVQSVKLQYIRASLFYKFELPLGVSIFYSLYSGMRYNQDFYDVGGVVGVTWKPFDKYLQISGVFQPIYDSDLGRQFGYSFGIQTIPLSEVGLFIDVENLPDYRTLENRIAVGLVFNFPHMVIKPEISVPIDFNLDYARISVSFVYENLFQTK